MQGCPTWELFRGIWFSQRTSSWETWTFLDLVFEPQFACPEGLASREFSWEPSLSEGMSMSNEDGSRKSVVTRLHSFKFVVFTLGGVPAGGSNFSETLREYVKRQFSPNLTSLFVSLVLKHYLVHQFIRAQCHLKALQPRRLESSCLHHTSGSQAQMPNLGVWGRVNRSQDGAFQTYRGFLSSHCSFQNGLMRFFASLYLSG